ncbi:uncharacterized protein LOC106672999 [Cimex lectularius]|uniref:Uncharacterized protein n=1 Tax=Cimex lectularius TaxID=79782 RepID=A0A8I6SBW9_CIMLE|nr:uncharacterized protein LOC106672999 [Cimex lectularius]
METMHESSFDWFRIGLFVFQFSLNCICIGVAAGWIADSWIHKFKLHTTFLTFTSIASFLTLVFSIDYEPHHRKFHLFLKYEYILFFTWNPIAFSIYFDQVIYKKSELGLNTPTFLCVWTRFVTQCIFSALYNVIVIYFGHRFLYFFVSLTTTLILATLIIVTLLFARWGFKPPVFFNLPYTTLLYGAYTCEIRLREKFGVETEERRDPRKFPPNVQFMCKRFWAVTILALFIAFYGHMKVLATVIYTMLSILLVGTTNSTFYAFDLYSSLASTIFLPIYYYCSKRYKWFSNDFGLIGVGKIIMVISLSYLMFIHMVMDFQEAAQPEDEFAQIRIFNILDSPTDVISSFSNLVIEPLSYVIFSRIKIETHGLETTMEINNRKHRLHQTSAVTLMYAASLCYYVGNEGLEFAGIEPIPPRLYSILSEGLGNSPKAYFVSPYKDAELSVRYKDGRVIQIPRINSTDINYADIFEGTFDVLVTAQGKTRVHYSNFESYKDRIYAILLFDPTSVSGVKIFTVKHPKVLPVQFLLPSAAFFGLGIGIVIFHRSKCFVTEVPPPLRSVFISAVNFFENIPKLSYYWHIYFHFIFDLKLLQINITILFIFLLLYGSLVIRHRRYTFTTYSSDVEPEKLPKQKTSTKELTNVMAHFSESSIKRERIE